jgi:hypothetical protein
MSVFWIYKLPGIAHWIAKRDPFSMRIYTIDLKTGMPVCDILQGISMYAPATWEWIQWRDGRCYAGFGGQVYDVTEITMSKN